MATSHWVANRDITVAHGVKRKEGEHVPEVDDWKDPEHWERAKHIRKVAGPAPGMPGGNGCLHHKMVDGACEVCGWTVPAPKVAPVPEPVVFHEAPPEPEPEPPPGLNSASLTNPVAVVEFVTPETEPEPEPAAPHEYDPRDDRGELTSDGRQVLSSVTELLSGPEPEFIPEPAPKYLKGELARKRKSDVQDIAMDLDIEVDELTKAQVIDAILKAQGA